MLASSQCQDKSLLIREHKGLRRPEEARLLMLDNRPRLSKDQCRLSDNALDRVHRRRHMVHRHYKDKRPPNRRLRVKEHRHRHRAHSRLKGNHLRLGNSVLKGSHLRFLNSLLKGNRLRLLNSFRRPNNSHSLRPVNRNNNLAQQWYSCRLSRRRISSSSSRSLVSRCHRSSNPHTVKRRRRMGSSRARLPEATHPISRLRRRTDNLRNSNNRHGTSCGSLIRLPRFELR